MIKREPAEYIIRIKPTPEEYKEHIRKEAEQILIEQKALKMALENENTSDSLKGD